MSKNIGQKQDGQELFDLANEENSVSLVSSSVLVDMVSNSNASTFRRFMNSDKKSNNLIENDYENEITEREIISNNERYNSPNKYEKLNESNNLALTNGSKTPQEIKQEIFEEFTRKKINITIEKEQKPKEKRKKNDRSFIILIGIIILVGFILGLICYI